MSIPELWPVCGARIRESGETLEARFEHCERVRSAAIEILQQGEELLESIATESYIGRVPLAFNGSIGGHYRHCLDHFTSVLRGIHEEFIDYDQRDRNPRIERDPEFALSLTRNVRRALERLPIGRFEANVTVRCEVSYTHGDSPLSQSTLSREVGYCIAHAIHHFALIAIMAGLLEIPLSSNFGIAPSTAAHLRKQPRNLPK